MKSWRWMLTVGSMTFREILTYRVEFVLNFFFYVWANFAVAAFLWTSIFKLREVEQIGGRTLEEMIFYYMLAPTIFRCLIGAQRFQIPREIYEGELSKYLLYPLSYFSWRFISHFSYTLFYFFQFALNLGIFALIFGLPEAVKLTPLSLASGFFVLLFSSYLYFRLASCLGQVAFWQDNVWTLLILLQYITRLCGGFYLPLDLFPPQVEQILGLLPFDSLITFPLRTFLGEYDLLTFIKEFIQLTLWIGIIQLVSLWIWRRGLRVYSGVGL